ncbi:MAG: DNA polymerase III subunit delta' [Clostridia bacterium]|nr:DNA polymerase III subunit delta' [Clostridia bacterium]
MEFNTKEKAALLAELNRGIISHAYIIEGAAGLGKKAFALDMAQAVLCTGDRKPCGSCSACRKCADGNHPDLHIFTPDGNSFKVDLVRDIRRGVTLTPGEGDRAVYILQDAHLMTAAAQNALLKVFEEPPLGTVFFLLTEKREALLPTVRSRGRTVRLSAAEDGQVYTYLKERFPKAEEKALRDAVRMAEGAYGRAEAIMKKEGKTERDAAAKLCSAVFRPVSRYGLYTAFLGQARKRESLVQIIDYLTLAARDVLCAKLNCGESTMLAPEEAAGYAAENTGAALYEIFEALLECARSLRRNTDGGTALTELCRRITQGKG